MMISENCSLDEFVDAVKEKETWEVITMAVEEATQADRMFYRARQDPEDQFLCNEKYSGDLKQLINYLRYTVKPRRPNDKAYHLYLAHWGTPTQQHPDLLEAELSNPAPSDTVQ